MKQHDHGWVWLIAPALFAGYGGSDCQGRTAKDTDPLEEGGHFFSRAILSHIIVMPQNEECIIMKHMYLLLCLAIAGCGGDQTGSQKVILPLEDGIFTIDAYAHHFSYREIQQQNNELVTHTAYALDNNSNSYVGSDLSVTEGGRLNARMTEAGWQEAMSESRDSFYINEAGLLVDNRGYFPRIWVGANEEDLSGKDIHTEIYNASWGAGFAFKQGAKRFYARLVNPDYVYAVEPVYCAPDCYGIPSFGGGTLEDWMLTYAAGDNATGSDGYYWYGLSMLFHQDGGLTTYDYFSAPDTPMSTDGSWKIDTVNGEQILLISIPFSDKQRKNIQAEANPMVTLLGSTRVPGVWLLPSSEVPSEYVQHGSFLNRAAIEDLISTYISSL